MSDELDIPTWWPPKVGDKLRKLTHHQDHSVKDCIAIKRVEALVHVVSVFEHVEWIMIVGAEWFPTRQRWHYEVYNAIDASTARIWRYGESRPR